MTDAQAKLFLFLLLAAPQTGPAAGEVEISRRELAERLDWSLAKAHRTLLELVPKYISVAAGSHRNAPSKVAILRFQNGAADEPESGDFQPGGSFAHETPDETRRSTSETPDGTPSFAHETPEFHPRNAEFHPRNSSASNGHIPGDLQARRSGEEEKLRKESGGGRAHARPENPTKPPAAAGSDLVQEILALQADYGPCDRSPDFLARRLLDRSDVAGDQAKARAMLPAMRAGMPKPGARKPFQFFLSDFRPGAERPAEPGLTTAAEKAEELCRRLGIE